MSGRKRNVEADDLPRKLPKINFLETMTVHVGSDEKVFKLHKSAVMRKAPFLDRQVNIMNVPRHDEKAFEAFAHWLYFDKLDYSGMLGHTEASGALPSYVNLGQVWALAHDMEAYELCVAVIDGIIRKDKELAGEDMAGCISQETIYRLWCMDAEGSEVRALFTEIVLNRASEAIFSSNFEKWPVEIIFGAAKKWGERIKREAAEDINSMLWAARCKYHKHELGTPKCV